MKFPTPTRAGDWRVINGQLVDVSVDAQLTQASPRAERPSPPAPLPLAGEGSTRTRNRNRKTRS